MRKNYKYEKILSVSANLMSQKGFRGVSFQEIAERSKLPKSSLFYYFRNKEELLLRILEGPFDECYRNFQKIAQNDKLGPKEKLYKAIENHLSLLIEHRPNSIIFLNELRSLSAKNRRIHFLTEIKKYEKGFEKIIVEMKKEGYFEAINSKSVVFGILGMLNWVMRWYRNDGPLTIEEITADFYRMLTKG